MFNATFHSDPLRNVDLHCSGFQIRFAQKIAADFSLFFGLYFAVSTCEQINHEKNLIFVFKHF